MLSKSKRIANSRWNRKNKYKEKVYHYRSNSRRFLKSYADLNDLEEAEKLIKQRKQALKK